MNGKVLKILEFNKIVENLTDSRKGVRESHECKEALK